jgi:hypothetical protein
MAASEDIKSGTTASLTNRRDTELSVRIANGQNNSGRATVMGTDIAVANAIAVESRAALYCYAIRQKRKSIGGLPNQLRRLG